MNDSEKIKRMEQVMETVGKLPITLPLSDAEVYVLSQWIAKSIGTAYETGLKDGRLKGLAEIEKLKVQNGRFNL